jgi:hypothetical protein
MATRLLVKAGEHTRQQCPVSAEIETAGLNPECLVLTTEEGLPIPCQVEQVGDKLHLSWVLDELAAKQEAVFLVGQGDAPDQAGVELSEKQTGQIDVSLSGKLFTSFCYGPPWSRPFLHPVIGPYGEPITRAYPVVKDVPGESQDHPHHKSFWVAWGDVNDADNWSESEKGHAHQVVRELKEAVSGPAFGRISCGLDWVSEAGEKQLEEDRELVFHNLSKSCRAVDLKVVFRATEGKIRFGDTKEGGICSIRVATSMDAGDQGTIVNSYGGTNEAETWGKRAQWCDYYGPVAGKTVGIAILDHPTNFRHPTYWHVRNYGLMTANPFGLSYFLGDKQMDGSHTLAAGEELTFRYRVLFHTDTTEEANVADKYNDYINPPVVSPPETEALT